MSRISTWDDACAHLAARGAAVRTLDADRLEVALAADPRSASPSSSAPRARVSRIDVLGAPWLELVMVVGSARSLPITTTLRSNAATAIGAFCFVDGELALRQTLPLEGLRVADLDWALKVMAWRVTETQRQLGLGEPPRGR